MEKIIYENGEDTFEYTGRFYPVIIDYKIITVWEKLNATNKSMAIYLSGEARRIADAGVDFSSIILTAFELPGEGNETIQEMDKSISLLDDKPEGIQDAYKRIKELMSLVYPELDISKQGDSNEFATHVVSRSTPYNGAKIMEYAKNLLKRFPSISEDFSESDL